MREQFRRRRLPHWDPPGATFFVTTCLAESIPAQGLLEVARLEQNLLANRPDHVSLSEWKIMVWKKVFAVRDDWLDRRPAVSHLQRDELAQIVAQSLKYFAGQRYELISWVLMPSHFHWVFRPLESWVTTLHDDDDRSPRERIMHSIKRYSARMCNIVLGTHGPFWQDESYDHVVRDEEELQRIIDYIELNPVKARLCEMRQLWKWSSAYVGQVFNLP